ncbi:MAG: GNAT family N-acetyltransferase [Chloroflexi bacterium]|nr:GNAT family N-acetyltransferase [Chloroflexota bacterium]
MKEESFATLEKAWGELLPHSSQNSFFLTPLWQKVWWQELGKGLKLRLLSLRHGDQLIAVAPLLQSGPTISFVGDQRVSDYLDFVVASGEETTAYSKILDYLEGLDWNTIDLHSIPTDSPTMVYLPSLARARDYSAELTMEDVCPRVSLPSTWEEYFALLSKKDRHELRRKLRRLERAGTVRYYATNNKDQLDKDLEDFFRLHRLSSHEKAEFMSPEMERFFSAMASAQLEVGHLKLFFLELNGARVAATLCFDYADTLALYNSGFDPAYAHLSVGVLLKALSIKEAISWGKKSFDFLRGSEPYKYDLGGQDLTLYRCRISRPQDRVKI